MEVILMRHGKAEERGSRSQDSERELTEKGREKTVAAAKGMANLIKPGSPVTIWTSPLKRAVQTAEQVSAIIKCIAITEKDALATGRLEDLHQDLKEFDREGTLLIIGHEPYLSHWGAIIAGAVLPLKTSSAMAITLSSAVPPEGDVLWFAHSQALRRLAPPEKPVRKRKTKEKSEILLK